MRTTAVKPLFVHLRLHTEYSLIDNSVVRVAGLMDAVRGRGHAGGSP